MESDETTRYLSPQTAAHNTTTHHSRTRSFKNRPRPRLDNDDDFRPRRNSMPSQARSSELSSSFNDLLKEKEQEQDRERERQENLQRVRSFKTTAKGGVVNRGDSYKKRTYKEILGIGIVKDENTDPRTNERHGRLPSQTSEHSQESGTGESSGGSSTEQIEQTGFTVVVLGPPGVGKTSLISQFMTSEYVAYEAGSFDREEERTISVLLDGEESTLNFIDPSRDEVDLDETHVDAYLVVFSTNDREAFNVSVDTLYQLRHEVVTDRTVILVANKIDLARKREVGADEARAAAHQYDCKYAETSAALNHHVDELLVGILKQIRLHLETRPPEDESVKKNKERKGSFKIARGLISKLFGKNTKKDKSCENLYEL